MKKFDTFIKEWGLLLAPILCFLAFWALITLTSILY